MAKDVSVGIVDRSYFYWRGGLGILVGILILVWPKLTVLTFVTLISLWFLLVGALTIIEGIASIKRGGWGWLGSILLGLVELGVGAYLIQRPSLTTLTIITLIGLVFIVQGVIHFINAFADPTTGGGHRMLQIVFAVLSIIAGVWIWRYPFHGTLAFVWLLGLYAIASGTMLIAMGSSLGE